MLALNVACLGLLLVCGPSMQKYIVTLPLAPLTGEQREIVFEVCGKDRVDALLRSGATVWTAAEWSKAQESIKRWEKSR